MSPSVEPTTAAVNNGTTSGIPPRPQLLKVLPDNIPADLTKRDHWVVSRLTWKPSKAKWDKPPLISIGNPASSTNRKTWDTFGAVYSRYATGKYDCIGFVLTTGARVGAIDLDGCYNPETGETEPEAQVIVDRFASYTEISPSGTGIRIFAYCVWPRAMSSEEKQNGRKVEAPWKRGDEKAEIEVAFNAKYMTVTGHHIEGTPRVVIKNQAAMDWLFSKYFEKTEPTKPTTQSPLDLDDNAILEKAMNAKNSAKFNALWSGDAGAYGSPSEADSALCCLLAYWTRDASQIDRLWLASGLQRGKTAREDYRARTIKNALETVTEQYDPARRIVGMMNGTAPMPNRASKAASKPTEAQPSEPEEEPSENITPEIVITPVQVSEKLPTLGRELILHCLDAEEAGDAELFDNIYSGRRVLFDFSDKQWYLWSGHYYRPDKTGIVRRLVMAQLANQYLHHAAELTREAEAEGESGARKLGLADKLIKRAKQLRNLRRVKNILELAQSWLGIEGNEWDAKPNLLAFKNGVLELSTGLLRAGKTDDLLRTVAPVEWKGLNAPAPRFEQFILEIMANNEETGKFLQRLLGYALYGEVLEHILPIFWGAGRNGKDTLLEILGYVLGAYASAVSADVLIADKRSRPSSGAATPHLCDLQGKRLVWASEPDEGAHLSVGQVKYVTGGGQISARQLHGRQFTFNPSHLLLLITNHRPRAGKDYALWKRIHLIEFTQKFVTEPQAPDEHKADETLEEKLRAEASGIAAWLVRGYLDYKQQRGLNPPEAVKDATREYQAKEDVLQQFINDCCLVESGSKVKAGELYKAYQDWAGKGTMWRNSFGEQMAEKYTKKREKDGVYYLGIRLNDVGNVGNVGFSGKKTEVNSSRREKTTQETTQTTQTTPNSDDEGEEF